jgi:ubiquinone/menaquinone biosynthesis C-methylase UbiE
VEPSNAAVADGVRLFPDVEFRRGLAACLPCDPDERFDLVIVNFVLHWVSRNTLMASMAEIDRVVGDGGYLILGDFLPDYPQNNPYCHRVGDEVCTFKLDYGAVFESTALYSTVCKRTYNHDHVASTARVRGSERAVCQLLRKSLLEFYAR